jgi:hypothetical protein
MYPDYRRRHFTLYMRYMHASSYFLPVQCAPPRTQSLLTIGQILDTVIGSEAAHVYPRLGYTEFGRLPRYGISPIDGSLVDEIFYFKDLRKA